MMLLALFAPWAANAQKTLTVYDQGGSTTSFCVPFGEFTTECEALTNFPITFGFETSEGFPENAYDPTSNLFGQCWRNEATVQTGVNPTRVWGTSTSSKHTGSQALVLPIKGNYNNPAKTMLVFPEMNFTDANGYVVSFWIYRDGTNTSPEGFKVYASDCDTIGPNAVLLGHYSRNYSIDYPVVEPTCGWYQYETNPITMTGSVYIIFEGQSYGIYDTYVDDIEIKVAPSCLKPTGLAATATTTSAELSWTANSGETAWTLYWKKTTDENYTEVPNATNPYMLNGLTAATLYQYYVVANCSADDASEASRVFTFATVCDVLTIDENNPYTENFDGYTVPSNMFPSSRILPICWDFINNCTYGNYKYYPTLIYNSTINYANSTRNSLRFYSCASSSSNYDPQPQYAILPEMGNINVLILKLQARAFSTTENYNATFKVGVMEDNTFVQVGEAITPTTTTYQQYTIPFNNYTGSGVHLAIMIEAAKAPASGYAYRSVFIDEITVEPIPSCVEPSSLDVVDNSITTTSV